MFLFWSFRLYGPRRAIYTDPSALGVDPAMEQQATRCKHHAFAEASRTTTQADSYYYITNHETLAVVWSLNNFRDIILSCLNTVFISNVTIP